MHHLVAVPEQSLLLFTGVSVNLKKIPWSARPKIQGFSYPSDRVDTIAVVSGDPTDLKIALNTPNNLSDALGFVSGAYFS